MRGLFITFEGGEGVGKTTQMRLLAERLSSGGTPVTCTREPGGTASAEAIRTLLKQPPEPLSALAETLMFNAARVENLRQTIRPALARGDVVVCDRFMDSTRAYQVAGGGVDAEVVRGLEDISVGTTRPDLTLILDLDPELGLQRAAVRAALDGFEQRDIGYHQRLRQAFVDIARAEPARCVLIDATQTVDDIATSIWAAVSPHITRWSPASEYR